MKKLHRLLRQIAESEGLTVDRIDHGKNLKIRVTNPAGVKAMVVVGISSQLDAGRDAKNVRATCRAIATQTKETALCLRPSA